MFKSILAVTVVSILSFSGVASAAVENPKTNHASYWGEFCSKTEMSGDIKYYTPTETAISKVIVKGGTGYTVYKDGSYTNLTAPLNQKNNKNYGISHVIVCTAEAVVVEPVPVIQPKPVENPIPVDKPVNNPAPEAKKQPVAVSEVAPVEDEGGKGGPTNEIEYPAELPVTGPADKANIIALGVGMTIIVTALGYAGALTAIKKRLVNL